MTKETARYAERARELLLSALDTAAFIELNTYLDSRQALNCPSCGGAVSGFEHDRLRHARTCEPLRVDVFIKQSREEADQ